MSKRHDSTPWRPHLSRLDGAYAPATMKSYRSDVEAFARWCEDADETVFPATPEAVCRFIEDQGRRKAPATIRRRLYAIRKVHNLLGLPDPTRTEDVNLTLRRILRAKAARPRQAKGLSRPYLERFLACQPDTLLGLRNRAMLSLGYELLTRRSELVALRVADLEWQDDGTLRVLIARSKTDQMGEGRLAFTSPGAAAIVREWLDWRNAEIG